MLNPNKQTNISVLEGFPILFEHKMEQPKKESLQV